MSEIEDVAVETIRGRLCVVLVAGSNRVAIPADSLGPWFEKAVRQLDQTAGLVLAAPTQFQRHAPLSPTDFRIGTIGTNRVALGCEFPGAAPLVLSIAPSAARELASHLLAKANEFPANDEKHH